MPIWETTSPTDQSEAGEREVAAIVDVELVERRRARGSTSTPSVSRSTTSWLRSSVGASGAEDEVLVHQEPGAGACRRRAGRGPLVGEHRAARSARSNGKSLNDQPAKWAPLPAPVAARRSSSIAPNDVDAVDERLHPAVGWTWPSPASSCGGRSANQRAASSSCRCPVVNVAGTLIASPGRVLVERSTGAARPSS